MSSGGLIRISASVSDGTRATSEEVAETTCHDPVAALVADALTEQWPNQLLLTLSFWLLPPATVIG